MTKPLTIEKKTEIMNYLKEHTWKETSNKFGISEMTINRIQNDLNTNTLTNANNIDTLILKKMIPAFLGKNIEIDFETTEIVRIKQLYGEIKNA